MPTPEHTDPRALDELYRLTSTPPRAPWYRVVWRWIREELFKEPYEARTGDAVIVRRIRIHELATAGARRLHKLDREEAAEILVVTAMLLGFEESRVLARRQRVR